MAACAITGLWTAWPDAAAAAPPGGGSPAPELDGAILPGQRVVAFYGAPQLRRTVVGRFPAAEAARRLDLQAAGYERGGRPVVPAFELVATIATRSRGRDRQYRTRQRPETIELYLDAARRAGALLVLDIQPGRSDPMAELRALRRWLSEPEVSVALDPEWNVGPRGVPGRGIGSVDAATVNRISAYMASVVEQERLPQKLLVVHQFTERMIRDRERLEQRDGVALTVNFDGIGPPRAKRAGYRRFARTGDGLFHGIGLFLTRDSGLLAPADVLGLRPSPDYVLYQ